MRNSEFVIKELRCDFIPPSVTCGDTFPSRGKAMGSTLEGELAFSQKMTEGGIINHPDKFKFDKQKSGAEAPLSER